MSLSYVVSVALWSPAFTIKSVRAVGVQGSLAQQVRTAAGSVGANLFALQTSAVRAAVLSLPDIQRAEVTPSFPDRVDVAVVPYVPAAVWRTGGAAYLVTGDGLVIRSAASQTLPAGLVVIDDPRPLRLAHGDRIDVPSLEGAIQLRQILAARGVAAAKIVSVPDATLEVDGSGGWRALFDLRGDLPSQADVLVAVLGRRVSFQVLDLRAGQSPFYR